MIMAIDHVPISPFVQLSGGKLNLTFVITCMKFQVQINAISIHSIVQYIRPHPLECL